MNARASPTLQEVTDASPPYPKPTLCETSDFVKRIVEAYQKDAGLVGEERNIAKLFFCIVSKYLPRKYRNHAIIVSSSSAGKSILANTVTLPFTSDVLNYTRVTGAALDRFANNLDGKIFLYQQAHGDEPYQLKPILSEGRLSLLLTERDEQTHRFVPKQYDVEGMPVFLATTTDPNIDSELLNRALIITLDESNQQTRRIIDQRAKLATRIETTDFRSLHLIGQINLMLSRIRSTEIKAITIPFAKILAESLPDEPLELRRDVGKIINLISGIAYAKAMCYGGFYETAKVKGITQKVIVAEPEDLYDALWCMGEDWLLQLPSKAKQILEYLRSRTDKTNSEEFEKTPYKEIFLSTGIPRPTGQPYLQLLDRKGLVTVSKAETGNAKFYQYHPNEKKQKPIDLSCYNRETWISENLTDARFEPIEDPLDFNTPDDRADRSTVDLADSTCVGITDSAVDNPDTKLIPRSPTVLSKNDKGVKDAEIRARQLTFDLFDSLGSESAKEVVKA